MGVGDIMLVGAGGGLGSLLRWQLGRLIDRQSRSPFKVGTFFINVSGAFVIAYFSGLLAIGWEERYGTIITSFLLTGVLGGYTTFSTMQLDAVQMTKGGRGGLAFFYLLASVIVGLLAAWAGFALGRA